MHVHMFAHVYSPLWQYTMTSACVCNIVQNMHNVYNLVKCFHFTYTEYHWLRQSPNQIITYSDNHLLRPHFFTEHPTGSPSSRMSNGQPHQLQQKQPHNSDPSGSGGHQLEDSPTHSRTPSMVGSSADSLSRSLELFDNFLIGVHRKMV